MRKKITAAVLLIIALCLTLCGCNNVNGRLNKLAKAEYSSVKLTVNVNFNGAELSSVYVAKALENDLVGLEYEYRVLNEIKEENGSFVSPEDYVSTFKGSATVQKNGKNVVVEQNGDKSDLSLKEISAKNLNFSKRNFSDVKDENGSFSASIVNLSGFLGSDVPTESAEVAVKYNENALIKITVNLTTKSGAVVVAMYEFVAAE